VKLKYLVLTILSLITCLAGSFTGCTNEPEGVLPQFSSGDQWVIRWVTGGEEYTVTYEVTGEEFLEGKDCYVMETTFEPPYMGELTGTTNKYEKANFDIVTMDFHSTKPDEFTSITYQITGTPFYPLVVGKKYEKTEIRTITTGNSTISQTSDVTAKTTTVVEKIEKITVEAGTFKCFKLIKYDENGNLIQITWRADETKLFQVKITDIVEEDAIYELISYSVSKE
jgi:hypothetical protein